MLNRSLGWMLIALGLGAFTPDRVSAQGNTSTRTVKKLNRPRNQPVRSDVRSRFSDDL
jgi:hypothetical protein